MNQVSGRILFCAALAIAAAPSFARAQTAPAPEALAAPAGVVDGGGPVGVIDRPRSEFDPVGIPAGSFIFYPSSIGSVTFDDNVYGTQTNKVSDVIFQDQSAIRAAGDFGATQLGGYAGFTSRVYARRASFDSVAPNVGLGLKHEISPDFVINSRTDYAYNVEDPAQTRLFSSSSTGSQQATPVRYHDFSTSTSVNKSFGPFYASLGGAFRLLSYNAATDASGNVIPQSYRDAALTTVTGRAGYEFGPGLKVFVEPSVNFRDYYNFSGFNSTGLQVVGGLAADFSRLMQGEVYAGYMQQAYRQYFGVVGGFTAGARLRWFPTELLTVSALVDRRIAEGSLNAAGAAWPNGLLLPYAPPGVVAPLIGGPLFQTNAELRADYELLRNLILTERFVYSRTKFDFISRTDNLYTAGSTATWLINRWISTSLDYRHMWEKSTIQTQNFTRNQITASIKVQW